MTTIRYFIPEDGDTEINPNVFLAPRSRQTNQPPLLNEIKEAFPLPGKYHFRFKSPLVPGGDTYGGKGSNMAVWMDCTDDTAPVPLWRGAVITKVTRIGIEEEDEDDDEFRKEEIHSNGGFYNGVSETPSQTSQPDMFETQSSNHSGGAPSSRGHSVSPSPTPQTDDLFNVFDGPSEPSASAHSSVASSRNTSEADLFGNANAPAPASGGSLLDMNTPSPAAAPTEADFFGAGAAAPAPAPPSAHDDLLQMRYTPTTTPPTQPPMQQRVAPQVQHQHQHHMPPQQHHMPPQQHHMPPQQQQRMGGYPQGNNANVPPQQQQQQRMGGYPQGNNGNAFDGFANQQGPFGNLSWNHQQQNRGRY